MKCCLSSNMPRRTRCLILLVGAALALPGCVVGPNFAKPKSDTPDVWASLTGAGRQGVNSGEPLIAWWRQFHDDTLDQLIVEAMKSNPGLELAEARVREARATRDISFADFWPQLNLTGNYEYKGISRNSVKPARPHNAAFSAQPGIVNLSKGTVGAPTFSAGLANGAGAAITPGLFDPTTGAVGDTTARLTPRQRNAPRQQRAQNLFEAGFDATWEIDLFGRIQRSVESATASVQASEEVQRGVLVTLLSDVARNYVDLRGAQRRLAIARQNVVVQQDTLEVTRVRLRAGLTSQLDVAQAETQLETTRAGIPSFETQIRLSIYQLSVLLGRPPGDLLGALLVDQPIPLLPPEVPIGLPSDLLRRRPDIREAERNVAVATAEIGVATADLFPRVVLNGSAGPQTYSMARFLDQQSVAWSLGPQISWPVFQGGRIRANIEVQNARQAQALVVYKQAVLTALQDTENALTAYGNERTRRQTLAAAEKASLRAADLSNDLYTRGLTPFLNVLDAQRTLYVAQDALAQSEIVTVTNLISLYKALGGGWESQIN